MTRRQPVLKLGLMLAGVAGIALAPPAWAQQPQHPIPQSVRLDHEDLIARLTTLSQRPPPVGPAAQQALSLLQAHIKNEEAFIFPPLTLLPALASGQVSAEMKWAIPMADRVKAERETIYEEHTKITDAMNNLLAAAEQARDADAADFARGAVADSLMDMEVMEPMTIVIGDYLRAKLPAGQ